MADVSTIELADLIEQRAAIRFGEKKGRGERATRKGGPCPFCGLGTDRFAVFVNDIPQHFICGIHGNGCGAYGDAITFLRELYGYSYRDACDELGVDVNSRYTGSRKRQETRDDEPPGETWQTTGIAFCKTGVDALWDDEYVFARNWLAKRGLTEETDKTFATGYNPVSQWVEPEAWGLPPADKDIWLPRGIVIPWKIDGNLWKISIRRPDKDIIADKKQMEAQGIKGEPPKYVSVAGGSNGLYGANEIRPGEPLVIVEGEFDKQIFKQVVGNRIPCVATGSTGKGREELWRNLIAQASLVLICFDYDAAGKKAYADYWHDLPNAVRWAPWAHDVNEMFLQGINLNEWIDTGLNVATLTQTVLSPLVIPSPEDDLQARLAAFTSRPCLSCGGCDYTFLVDGSLICPCYFIKVKENKKSRPAFDASKQAEAARGLPAQCCMCKALPVFFGVSCTAYCERHKPASFMDSLRMADNVEEVKAV